MTTRTITSTTTTDVHDPGIESFADEIESIIDEFCDPTRPASWPEGLPAELQYGHHEQITWDPVVPSWNRIPLREVVRFKRTVAVIDFPESKPPTVVHWQECATEDDAEQAYADWLDEECGAASRVYVGLSEEEQRGALLT